MLNKGTVEIETMPFVTCHVVHLTKNPANTVTTNAPTNPSHVFRGDRGVSLVLPKVIPKMYAKLSLQIINPTGNRNLDHEYVIVKCTKLIPP